MFDYLRSIDAVGSTCSQQDHPDSYARRDVCLIDSDDLLDRPEETMRKFCEYIGVEYSSDMLNFTDINGDTHAATNLKHWGNAFHEEAMNSTRLLSRDRCVRYKGSRSFNCLLIETQARKPQTDEEHFEDWVDRFGHDAANVIKRTEAEYDPHYQYLKQFALSIDDNNTQTSR